MSKIVELRAENVKRLSAVHIKPDPDGNMVVIGGDNGQGKTSVLDSIMYALAGRKAIPDEVLRRGEKKGLVEIKTDELTIHREFSKTGLGQVKITRADGQPVTGPQGMLDALVGSLTFDPMAFDRMDSKKQGEVLREMLGLDFAEHDAARKTAYENRRDVNVRLDMLKKQIAGMPTAPADIERVSVSDLQSQIDAHAQEASAIATAEREVEAIRYRGAQNAETIRDLERMLAEANTKRAEIAKEYKAAVANVPTVTLSQEQFDELRTRLNSAHEINAQVDAAERRKVFMDDASQLDRQSREFTSKIEKLDDAKAKKIAEAKLPVDGLSFDGDDVTFGGTVFSECSAAERMRVSVAIGASSNSKLRIMLVRDASLLDSKSMALLAKLADETDHQLWVERVGDGDENAIIIEDGAIKMVKGETA